VGVVVLVSPAGGCPYQDTWFCLFEFPPLSLLDLMMVTTQRIVGSLAARYGL